MIEGAKEPGTVAPSDEVLEWAAAKVRAFVALIQIEKRVGFPTELLALAEEIVLGPREWKP